MEKVNRFTIHLGPRSRELLLSQVSIIKQHHDALRPDKVKLHGKHGAKAMTEMRGALRAISDALLIIVQAPRQ